MIKKFTAFIIIGLLIFYTIPFVANATEELKVTAPAALLMEASTGTVLYEKNADEKRPCASITKVMTLLLTMEAIESGQISLEDTLYASAHAASMGGSDIWLKEGEAMGVNDLIKATVVMSANDAAVVLAEAVAGSEESFVALMNSRAAELGMVNTVFKNCNGLDEPGHLTTVKDVAVMSRELIKHKKIFEYTGIWIDYVRGTKTQLVNTNRLVKNYKGITGLKTGTTSKAGSCIAATAKRDGMELIAVVLGCENTDSRFKDATALLNYGYGKWAVVSPEIPPLENVAVKNGMTTFVKVRAKEIPAVLAELSKKAEISTKVELEQNITAPVKVGQRVGEIKVLMGKKVVEKIPILADEQAEKITFGKAFFFLFKKYAVNK